MPRPRIDPEEKKRRKLEYKRRWRRDNPIQYSIQIERANDVRRLRRRMEAIKEGRVNATHEELTLRRLLEAQQAATMRAIKRAEDAEREVERWKKERDEQGKMACALFDEAQRAQMAEYEAKEEVERLRKALEAAKKSIEDAQPSIKLGGYNAFSALCIIREALK